MVVDVMSVIIYWLFNSAVYVIFTPFFKSGIKCNIKIRRCGVIGNETTNYQNLN